MKYLFFLFFFFTTPFLSAQLPQGVTLSGYLELYYCYDLGKPANHERPYMYSFTQHNELNVNLSYVKLAYNQKKLRCNLAIMAGTYANANLATEPGGLKNIYEGNIGIKIAKKRNIWADVGVFSAHIGFEGAVAKDCWTMSRSILSEYSPFYESGVKVTYLSLNEELLLSVLLLNGWQHIHRPNGNNSPSFGMQIQYKPRMAMTLNYSNFIGNDKPDSVAQFRHFHNFYAIAQVTEKTGISLGFDIGQEQNAVYKSKYSTWYSPLLIVRQAIGKKWFVCTRLEYYRDMHNVLINTSPTNVQGYRTFGYSNNVDFHYNKNLLWRVEARYFQSKDAIFTLNRQPSTFSLFFTSSLAVAF